MYGKYASFCPSAPSIDYKLINLKIREEKHLIKKNKIESILKSNSKKEFLLSDTLADGKLVGKWIERGINNLAGRMMTCDIDWENNTIYNASNGGNIWKANLSGGNWTCLNEWLKMPNVVLLKVFNHNSSKRIFVVSGTNAYYSDNEGLIWEKSQGLQNPNAVKRAVITNDNQKIIYFIGYEWDNKLNKSISCLYRSTDKGKNFEPVYKFLLTNDFCDLWTPKYFDNTVYFLHLDTLSKINPNGTIEKISNIKIDNFQDFKGS